MKVNETLRNKIIIETITEFKNINNSNYDIYQEQTSYKEIVNGIQENLKDTIINFKNILIENTEELEHEIYNKFQLIIESLILNHQCEHNGD